MNEWYDWLWSVCICKYKSYVPQYLLTYLVDSPEFKVYVLRNLMSLESEIYFGTDGGMLSKTKLEFSQEIKREILFHIVDVYIQIRSNYSWVEKWKKRWWKLFRKIFFKESSTISKVYHKGIVIWKKQWKKCNL